VTIEEDIIGKAQELGFAAAGIAVAAPSETMRVYRKWIAEGYAADMDYLKCHTALRSDPRKLAPGAKSVIATAARYPASGEPGAGFSTYARGQDYHVVLRQKLRQLADYIKGRAKISTARICVDSAPILEREWAVRAGIGWRGKQGQIVNPKLGCCLLLGELLVGIELRSSARLPNRCGTCRRCLDACPTGAVKEDGLLDPRECISYLTIEHKGSIPADIRPRLGEALFGCDMCTTVCPWNRFGNDLVMPELSERPMPGAAECINLTEQEFGKRFKDSVVLRTGPLRLSRNAAIALGNRKAGRP